MQFAYSGFVDQALERFTQGCRAIESGNLAEAATRFNQSFAINPSIEALVNLAEAQIGLGQWDEAVVSVSAATEWSQQLKPPPVYAIKLKQLSARFRSEGHQHKQLPPFSQRVEVAIQSQLGTAEIIRRLSDIAGISTDGASSLKGKKLFYDMVIGPKFVGWDEMIDLVAPQIPASDNAIRAAHKQKNLLYLTGPLQTIAQNIPSQPFLAQDILDTLQLICPKLDVLFVRIDTSGVVHTADRLYKGAAGRKYRAFIDTFTMAVRDDDGGIYTTGMHAVGYPDAKMSGHVVSTQLAIDVLHEFLECMLVNNIQGSSETMTFGSAVAQYKFDATLQPFPRNDYLGTTAFNRNGMWVLTPAGGV